MWYIFASDTSCVWHNFARDTSCTLYIFARDQNNFIWEIYTRCILCYEDWLVFLKIFLKSQTIGSRFKRNLKFDARSSCKIKWVNTEPLETHGKFHDTPLESSTYQRISLKWVFLISLFFHVMWEGPVSNPNFICLHSFKDDFFSWNCSFHQN